MVEIKIAKPKDYSVINDLAYKTWPDTFGNILSNEQMEYMLDWMYSIKSIEDQISEKGHVFLIAYLDNTPVGFASYELNYVQDKKSKLHKIYVLPSTQGTGVGKALLNEIYSASKESGNPTITLNVNKYNPSTDKYKKMGFSIVEEEVIDIGNGFIMDDYVMEKTL